MHRKSLENLFVRIESQGNLYLAPSSSSNRKEFRSPVSPRDTVFPYPLPDSYSSGQDASILSLGLLSLFPSDIKILNVRLDHLYQFCPSKRIYPSSVKTVITTQNILYMCAWSLGNLLDY